MRTSNPASGASVPLMCSNQNVLGVIVPDGSLTGASMSKELHLEPLSQLISQPLSTETDGEETTMADFRFGVYGVGETSVAKLSREAARLVS